MQKECPLLDNWAWCTPSISRLGRWKIFLHSLPFTLRWYRHFPYSLMSIRKTCRPQSSPFCGLLCSQGGCGTGPFRPSNAAIAGSDCVNSPGRATIRIHSRHIYANIPTKRANKGRKRPWSLSLITWMYSLNYPRHSLKGLEPSKFKIPGMGKNKQLYCKTIIVINIITHDLLMPLINSQGPSLPSRLLKCLF